MDMDDHDLGFKSVLLYLYSLLLFSQKSCTNLYLPCPSGFLRQRQSVRTHLMWWKIASSDLISSWLVP